MDRAIIDTDILSYYLKGDKKVVENLELYLRHFDVIEISIITYYEILGGLLAKNAVKQISVFEIFVENNSVILMTDNSAKISAELYSILRTSGKIVDDIDLLIAGIAIDNDLTLVTNNVDDFQDFKGLVIENWFL